MAKGWDSGSHGFEPQPCFLLALVCFSISKNKALGRVLGGAEEMACMRVPSLSPSSGNLGFLPLNWVGGGEGHDFNV